MASISYTGTISASTGLISGIDYDSLITQLTEASSGQVNILENKQLTYESRVSAFQTLNLRLTSLQSAMNELNDIASNIEKTVSNTDEDAFDVTVADNAQEGTHTVKVMQLAQGSKVGAQGFADMDETSVISGDGTFQFRLGSSGTLRTINVEDGTTLEELADLINDSDYGLQASIINDGSSTNPYRLVLSTTDTGLENRLIIENNDTDLNFSTTTIEDPVANAENTFDGSFAVGGSYTGSESANVVVELTSGGAIGAATFRVSFDGGLTFEDTEYTTSTDPVDIGSGLTVDFAAGTTGFADGDSFTIDVFVPELQQAQNAILRVDGIQVSRSSNTIDDVLDDVTLNLLEVSESTGTITIDTSTEDVTAAIRSFVTAYNSLVAAVDELTAYDVDSDTAAALFGDATTRSVKSALQSMISGGLGAGAESAYNNLGQIGISLENDGTLTIDATELNEALEDNFDDVVKLFSASLESQSDNITLSKATTAAKAGDYTIRITQAAEQAEVLSNQAIDEAGITQSETLTFTYGDEEFSIIFQAGMTLDEVIDLLNEEFADQNVAIAAEESEDDSGILRLYTTNYGSVEEFTVKSNRAGDTSAQLGIGTVKITAEGEDVAGTINGEAARGTGQLLKGNEGTDAEGLTFTITSTEPENIGTITVTMGIAQQFVSFLEDYTDSSDGIIAKKIDGLNTSVDNIDDQIEKVQERLDNEAELLRRQFSNLELMLAQYETQMSYLQQQFSLLTTNDK